MSAVEGSQKVDKSSLQSPFSMSGDVRPTRMDEEGHADSANDEITKRSKTAEATLNRRFLNAVQQPDAAEVRSLLTTGAVRTNVADTTDVKSFPIHWAACSDQNGSHLEVMEVLLTVGNADADVKNTKSQTPAMLAAANGNLGVLQILFATGADMRLQSTQGFTVVHFAAQNGHTLLLDFFRRCCHLALDDIDKDGRTPLHWAAYNGHRRTAEWLIDYGGCDVLASDDEQCLPIHWAALQGNMRMVHMLVMHGNAVKQLTAKECNGMTAQKLAAEKATRMDLPRKKKHYERLGNELKKLEKQSWRYKCLGEKLPNWGCMGGAAGYFFWALALVEWSISYYLYYSDNMLGLTGHRSLTTIVFFIGSLWQIGSWLLTVGGDPGFILEKKSGAISSKHKPAAAWNVLKQQYHDALKDKACTALSLDESDGIVRPLRSKHCAVSGRTVLRFDHFCPWMNNCIGRNNYIWFVSFLTATCFLSMSWVILGCTYLRVSQPLNSSLWQCVKGDPWRACWYMHYGVYLLYSILLCQQHFYLIAVNLTTNEQINKNRYDYLKDSTGMYHNPFNQGALKNFLDFFRMSEPTALPPRQILPHADDSHV